MGIEGPTELKEVESMKTRTITKPLADPGLMVAVAEIGRAHV